MARAVGLCQAPPTWCRRGRGVLPSPPRVGIANIQHESKTWGQLRGGVRLQGGHADLAEDLGSTLRWEPPAPSPGLCVPGAACAPCSLIPSGSPAPLRQLFAGIRGCGLPKSELLFPPPPGRPTSAPALFTRPGREQLSLKSLGSSPRGGPGLGVEATGQVAGRGGCAGTRAAPLNAAGLSTLRACILLAAPQGCGMQSREDLGTGRAMPPRHKSPWNKESGSPRAACMERGRFHGSAQPSSGIVAMWSWEQAGESGAMGPAASLPATGAAMQGWGETCGRLREVKGRHE